MNDDRDARIRTRAYEIWQEQGRPEGRTVEHWLEAERQLGGEEDSRSLEEDSDSEGAAEEAEKKSRREVADADRPLGAAKRASR